MWNKFNGFAANNECCNKADAIILWNENLMHYASFFPVCMMCVFPYKSNTYSGSILFISICVVIIELLSLTKQVFTSEFERAIVGGLANEYGLQRHAITALLKRNNSGALHDYYHMIWVNDLNIVIQNFISVTFITRAPN